MDAADTNTNSDTKANANANVGDGTKAPPEPCSDELKTLVWAKSRESLFLPGETQTRLLSYGR